MTVAQALLRAQSLGVDRLSAQRLLLYALKRQRNDRAWLIANDASAVDAAAQAQFEQLCLRVLDDEPLAYVLGEQEFYGLGLCVDHRVLVPRPDTETLVEWALALWPKRPLPEVIDLGTGSGAIALALAAQRPQANIHASDASAAALDVARDNAARLGLRVQWHCGHWWQALGQRRFDLALSNPPYIAAGDAHLRALRHEPTSALVAGEQGLEALRVIIDGAAGHLNPGAWLLLEHGHTQGEAVARLLADAGFDQLAQRQDLAGRVRCSGGVWRASGKPG